jgi:hypothetical protein
MYYDSLAIGVRHEPGYVILTAAGEIGIFTVARLRLGDDVVPTARWSVAVSTEPPATRSPAGL